MRGKTAVEIKFRFKELITEKNPKKMIIAGSNSAKEKIIIYQAYIENKTVLTFRQIISQF